MSLNEAHKSASLAIEAVEAVWVYVNDCGQIVIHQDSGFDIPAEDQCVIIPKCMAEVLTNAIRDAANA